MEIKTDSEIIERILNKGVEQILPSKEALKEKLLSGQRLNVYQGFDPTADTLHIGHSVGMRKLEDFRKLGHHVTFLIGDFTARIGDPSDKTSARQVLTKEQVEHNMQKYVEQANHVIDIYNKENPVEIKYNSEWHDKLNFGDIIGLGAEFTVQQMLKREMFQKRLEEGKPIYINEFMYPIMQGYDAVMMETDVEVGGNDQLFNMLAGRDMVFNHLGKEKFVLAGKLLESNDGEKMGKTTGNMIRLDEKPEDIYGKVMSFTDDLILTGFEILTSSTLQELETYKKRLEDGENPMILKKELAFRVTEELTSKEDAIKGQNFFENVFQKSTDDENIKTVDINNKENKLLELLVECNLANSKSEARRLIEQSAVSIDGEKQTKWDMVVSLPDNKPLTIKAGKKLCKVQHKN
ncbi:MAG: tyrosine--tRNA ligase [Candidatus Dojkabacteria bacterium]|nr:tyrosine--tRNA ligase [Candidatus Dojkabacteria bacterium]